MVEPHGILKRGQSAQGAGAGRRLNPVRIGGVIDRAGDDAILGSADLPRDIGQPAMDPHRAIGTLRPGHRRRVRPRSRRRSWGVAMSGHPSRAAQPAAGHLSCFLTETNLDPRRAPMAR
jgi:hypothetical protein